MFHVSLLKLYKGQPPQEAMPLPTHFDNIHPILEPSQVLQKRVILRDQLEVLQVLIQWQKLSLSEATWEDVDYM